MLMKDIRSVVGYKNISRGALGACKMHAELSLDRLSQDCCDLSAFNSAMLPKRLEVRLLKV